MDEVPRREEKLQEEEKLEEIKEEDIIQEEKSVKESPPIEEIKEEAKEELLELKGDEEGEEEIKLAVDTEQLIQENFIDVPLTELEEVDFEEKAEKEIIEEKEKKQLKSMKIIVLKKKEKKEEKIGEKEEAEEEIPISIETIEEKEREKEEVEEVEEIEEIKVSPEGGKLPGIISIPGDEVPRESKSIEVRKENLPPPPPPPIQKREEKKREKITIKEEALKEERIEIQTKKKEKPQRAWWEEIFDDDYLRLQPKLTEWQIKQKVTFIENSLEIRPGGIILDLACGTGVYTVEMASRGYQMVGLDLSLAMLGQAADLAQQKGQKINFIHGDMREMDFDSVFDGVFCIGNSFGYFDEETNFKVLKDVHRSLKVRGTFLLEIVNRDFVILDQPNMLWFEGDGCVCMEESYFNYLNSRLYVKRTIILDDGRQVIHNYNIRLYSIHEIGKMLHEAGFKVLEVSGHIHTPGAFMGPHSPYIIVLAEKEKRGGSK